MLNARVIFKKETKEAMEKPISGIDKRRLRLEKLRELDEGGYLASATNRMDVGEMVGLPNRKQAYDWTTREIVRGGVKETFVGFGSGNKPIYEYHYQPNQEKKKVNNNNSKISGREMFERLRELEKSGELKKAECRADLVRMLRFKDYKIGYTSIVNWIRRGHLRETEIKRIGIGPSAKVIARYSMTGSEPMFRDDTIKITPRKKSQKPYKIIEAKTIEEVNMPQAILDNQDADTIKIEITRSDITIKLEMPDYEKAGELVKTILKGE